MNTTETPIPGAMPAFDPEKAARMRTQAQDIFVAKFKKVERYLCIWMVVLMAVAAISAWNFGRTQDTKLALVYGIILLIAIEGSVLIRLWYWIVNNKLSVLRDLRMLRLELNLSPSAVSTLAGMTQEPERAPGLSAPERWFWKICVVALALVMGMGLGSSWPEQPETWMASRRTVVVESGGKATMETWYWLVNNQSTPIREYTVYSDGSLASTRLVAAEDSGVTDGFGRKLPVRLEPNTPSGQRMVISLPSSIGPGERFMLRLTGDTEARIEGGVWVVGVAQNWGFRKNSYEDTIVLPRGAQIISTDPPAQILDPRDGRPVVHFQGERAQSQRWWPVVRYRLPESGGQR